VKYSPTAMQGVMEVLQQAMHGNRTPELLSTHPYPETRIKAIQEALRTTYAGMVNNPEYKVFAPEYQQKFLRPLNVRADGGAASKTALAAAGLGDPVMWCQHCREAAAREALATQH